MEEFFNRASSDAEVVAEAKENLSLPYTNDIRGNITLPVRADNGAVIEWSADYPEIIDTEEHQNHNYDATPPGGVTRPEIDTNVTLTALISYGTASDSKEFKITVKARTAALDEADFTGYMFVYFAGEAYADGEQIYFASSTDGLNWNDLNANNPVLVSTLGEEGVRDPFIIRSPEGDNFYLIATDLRIYDGNGWGAAQTAGSQSIMIWESTDLVSWSEQRMVKVAKNDAGCTWAPEATYDVITGEYIVYWASRIAEDNFAQQRIYYAKTRDFYSFTEPELYIEKDDDIIDTTIIWHEEFYYRYSKDEASKRIVADIVPTLLHSSATKIDSVFLESQTGVEGPAIFKFNMEKRWCLLLDDYGGIGYYPSVTTNLPSGEFTKLTTGFRMPSRARHGTVISVTEKEYLALQQRYGNAHVVIK